MTTAALEVVGVSKRFAEHETLKNINLTVQSGEFVSLLGPSGCGKTTLLRIIAGFEEPTSGRVRIHGEDVTFMPPHRRPTNLVFQRGALFPHMNVFDNISYSLRLRRWSSAKIAARVDEMLSLVRLEGLGQRGPTELSGGQIQRAALARALAPGPRVLLLDEPLSALDLKLRQHMQLELRAIQRRLSATFVYVTHDQTEALVMSDRIAVMNEGRIVQAGTPREIYTSPASVFASDFIGETNLIRGTVVGTENGVTVLRVGEDALIQARGSHELQPGARATISVRPEAVRITTDMSAGKRDNSLIAKIDDLVFLGNRVRVQATTPGGAALIADVPDNEAQGMQREMCIGLSWSPSAATVWAEDGSTTPR